jgi:ferredoxin
MIITRQKPFSELLTHIDGKSVFLVGCSECATLCHTGGEQELLDMKKSLEDNKIAVTGWVVLEPACHLQNDRRLLKQHAKALEKTDVVLVFACGNGTQTVAELIEDADVLPGNDTLFLGEIQRAHIFEKRCTLCGDCIQDLFEGLCPLSRCPKAMLNGPCGGSIGGKCEVDADLDCIWDMIYRRLKEKGRLDRLKQIQEPKHWSASLETRRILSHVP